MNKPRVLVIISDGVSLRNFVYTSFYEQARENGLDLVFLNLTSISLSELGLQEIIPKNIKQNLLTDSFKNAKKRIELNQFKRRFDDNVYDNYWFPLRNLGIKSYLKNILFQVLIRLFNSEQDLLKLRTYIRKLERKTTYYKECLELIKEVKPDLIYSASQRSILAVAPVEAAKILGLPTVGFVFSWDNLPKSMLDVETDYYHVWSEHMREELITYYSFVKEKQVIVTGTPQFEMHFDKHLKQERTAFLNTFGLDPTKKYICFSGDDVTTSPHDPRYLADVAVMVRELNRVKDQWRIIFRRCPVDFSNRYDLVLQEYQNEITPIAPQWERLANSWDAVLPLKDDNALLVNTVAHCELVINLGSSMVFDAVCHGTPCAYIAYNPEDVPLQKDIKMIYQYIHFQSMPNEKPVFWLRNQLELKSVLKHLETEKETILKSAKKWFTVINQHPPAQSSQRIIDQLKQLS
jgi:hypothetical protein